MKAWLGALLIMGLAGCASTAPAPVQPARADMPVAVDTALVESLAQLMQRGYVVRYADADLGRIEAVLGRWPGYRVAISVTPTAAGSRVEMTGYRAGQALPPQLFGPWLTALRRSLGEAP